MTRKSLIVALAIAAPLSAQTFEVASVKALDVPFIEMTPKQSPGRITWTTDLWRLISYAFRLHEFQLEGPIPGSDSKYAYRVDATFRPQASDDEVRQMMQAMLAERFKMQFHWSTREGQVYALAAAKGEPKLKAAKPEDAPPKFPEWFGHPPEESAVEGRVLATAPERGIGTLTGRRATMASLCEALSRRLSSPVSDVTGLTGAYYFATRYVTDDFIGQVDGLSLPEALQKDLGLKLEHQKGPVRVLVVDHIESLPTEN